MLFQWSNYQEQIGELEQVIKVILDEYRRRVTSIDMTAVPNRVYVKTELAVRRILTAKTLREWKLISSLNDWRTHKTGTGDFRKTMVQESLFYLNFISELQTVLYTKGLELDDIGRWKLYYDYQRTSNFCVALHIIVGIFEALQVDHGSQNLTNATIEEFYKIVPKFNLLLEEVELESFNRSLSHSLNLLVSMIQVTTSSDPDTEFLSLDSFSFLKIHIHNKRRLQFQELTSCNKEVLKMAAITFCLSFLGFGLAVACTIGFGYLLREESRLAVLVADWFSHLESKVDQQKESTNTVLRQVRLNKYHYTYSICLYNTFVKCLDAGKLGPYS